MSRLFDPRRKDGKFPFEYVSAAATDVRKTFERARAEQAKRQAEQRPVTRLIKRLT